jgi:GT2 family glycosyltransferase
MNPDKSLSVIIPNYNGIHLLAENLPSVIESISKFRDHEIIVVDDASVDGSAEYIEKNFPSVVIIRNKTNLGFSSSMNTGIRASKKDLILSLNNDMKIGESYFTFLLPYFDMPDTFGVMGQISESKTNKKSEGLKQPLNKKFILSYKDLFPGYNNLDSFMPLFTLYVCGGCALFDRYKLQQLNGFSMLYEPFYFEDLDLSLRAWKSGWKCYYDGRSHCIHAHSATINANFNTSFVRKISKRNKLIVNYLFLNGFSRRIFLIITIIKAFFFLITFEKTKKSAYSEFIHKTRKNDSWDETVELYDGYNRFYSTSELIRDIRNNNKKALTV